MAYAYQIDEGRLNEAITQLVEVIRRQPEQWTSSISFQSGYLASAEGYKYNVFEKGQAALGFASWDRSMVGTGRTILPAAMKALNAHNNLTTFYTDDFERMGRRDLQKAETALYEVYRGDDDESAFNSLMDAFGRNYSRTAYLFFLKDKERYLPCKPEIFSKIFQYLNLQTEAVNGCSWEHYLEFIQIIREIQARIDHLFAGPVSLLDAHSFVWCFHLLDRSLAVETEGKPFAGSSKNGKDVFLSDAQLQLAEQLLISVRDHISVLTYKELADSVSTAINPHFMGTDLGKISGLCHQLGLPLLSAKVINQNAKTVGAGFFSLYKQLGIPTDGKTEEELYKAERKAIRECQEWYRLEDYLGLHIGLPRPTPRFEPLDEVTKAAEAAEDDALIMALQAEPPVPQEEFTYHGVPKPRPLPIEKKGRMTYPRDRAVAANALRRANYRCELDPEHRTFRRKRSDLPYTEPHHLVPLAYQRYFDVSLDVEENIVSLCCTCHKQIHFGTGAEELISYLYDLRKDALRSVGIEITKDELIAMYA